MKFFAIVFLSMLLSLILWNKEDKKYTPPKPDQLSANQFIPSPSEKKPETKVEPKKEAPKKNMVWSLTGVINQNKMQLQSTPIPK